ncbi:uncharacterized protein LOC126981434 [Eriocheir sinensis]|uniref:uncharacterized protein LOC126981434 n=1 Tax=Eriocheir sinensis TaxID=95602 RepID=UPI0021C81DC0|nr:uncharacterized protein LOC126981434 [Eriocheir sinensis]
MGGREAATVVLAAAMICLVDFLSLASAARASTSTSEQPQTSPQDFDRLAEIEKKATQEEADLLNKTREALLRVSQLIGSPAKGTKLDNDADGNERDACLLKEDTSPEAVAAAFEVFTRRLDPSKSVATLNDSLHQLLCFERVQAKVSPGTPSVREAASPQRPAVTRYINVLSEHLDDCQRSLHLLNYRFPAPPRPHDHLSGSLLTSTFGTNGVDKTLFPSTILSERHTEEELSQNLIDTTHQLAILISEAVGADLEFAAVKSAITVAKEAHTLMTVLRQVIESSVTTSNPSDSKTVTIRIYCQNRKDQGPMGEVGQKLLRAVSQISEQLINANGVTDITAAREELQCRAEIASNFNTAIKRSISVPLRRTLVNLIKEVITGLEDLTHHLENKEEQLAAHILEAVHNKSELEDSVNEATAIYLQHHQAEAPSHTIQKNKINVFHEVELDPGCGIQDE